MNVKLKKYATDDVITEIKNTINIENGNEIFFVCKLNSEKKITNATVIARGNKNAVSAIFQIAEHGEVVIHNHPNSNLQPSNADVSIASKFGASGVGFYIIDNYADMVNVVVEAFDKKHYKVIEHDELVGFFGKSGSFAKNLKDYEFRKQQMEMLESVAKAFNNNKIAIIEAGTGTGKSLAYLLPSVFWSVKNRERVVIATNTINLQEQLIKKDIPILNRCLSLKFKAVLVKGRNNYACLRKVESLKDGGQLLLEIDDNNQLAQILNWIIKTEEGCKEDVDFAVKSDIWDMIQCENDQCLRARCKFFGKCFFYNSRREATNADILVVNHHLLVADIALRKAMEDYNTTTILPPFKRIIIDEAHNIEDVFTSSFGVKISLYRIAKVLGRLQNAKVRSKGIFSYLKFTLQKLQSRNDFDLIGQVHLLIDEELMPELGEFNMFAHEIFGMLADNLVDHDELRIFQNEETRFRITRKFAAGNIWNDIIVSDIQSLNKAIRRYTFCLKKLLNKMEEFSEKAVSKIASVQLDIRSCLNRLQKVANDIDVFVDITQESDNSLCRWIEIKEYKKVKTLKFCYAPIDIANDMKNYVYNKFNTIVMTSATLSVNRNFKFFKGRVGLDRLDVCALTEQFLESPFNYEKQSLVCIPNDIVDPKDPGYANALKALILLAITISKGKALVLFTSHSLMNNTFFGLRHSILTMGYTCMKQGETSRHRLLENFKNDKTSVLFATDSFWQGIDVKGDALECVVVTKLPFRVPSEPIVQARAEFIEMKGGNSFYDYSLPLAVIKFKQGFGRLIRSHKDKGAVLIFDKRLVTKSYGREFINSLPKVMVVADKTDVVFDAMREFCQTD